MEGDPSEPRDDLGRDYERKRWAAVGEYRVGRLMIATHDNRVEVLYEFMGKRGPKYRTLIMVFGEERKILAEKVARAMINWDRKRRPRSK